MKKLFLAAMAALTISLSPVMAAECNTKTWTELTELFKDKGETIKLNPQLVAKMIEKVGRPPHIGEGEEFDAYLVTQGNLSAVFVVQDNCLKDRLGPAATETLKQVLGLGDA